MSERWAPVLGFEDSYEVSNKGRVRSLDRCIITIHNVEKQHRGRLLKLRPNVGGYLSLRLGKDNPAMVHQLVIWAFRGPTPRGKYVCHKDGTRVNNNLTNLVFATPKKNQTDRRKHGTYRCGSSLPQAILTERQVKKIKKLLGRLTHEEIGDLYGVHRGTISQIARGANWKHVS